MSDTAQNKEVQSGEVNMEWSYSGKALRAQALLFIILSLLLVGGGAYATYVGWFTSYYLTAWYCITGGLLLLWGYHYSVYFYRVWTIRYRLTERHLYVYRGLFTHTCDSTELVLINDVRLVRTLFDRLFNGGVGRLVIYSAIDKTDSDLVLEGIENPKEIFIKIDSLRTALRATRSILTSGS
jgi:uncharacterized membrane protein YdbT with pleckstrin-like domain